MTRRLFKLLISINIIIITLFSAQSIQAEEIDTQYSVRGKSFDQIIYETIEEFGYTTNNVSIAYYDFLNQKHYYLNEWQPMLAASASKVGTAALYANLINEGILTYDTEIPYNESLFEEGAGNITNGDIQESYLLSDLIYEILHYSDNTAWNLLTDYYYTNFGNYHEDLLLFSGTNIEDESLYEFNMVNAQVLEGILIQVGSSDIYDEIIDIMMHSQDAWLMKHYVNNDMAAKYGHLDEYFHDIGLYYQNGQAAYALVIMTNDLPIEEDGTENEFFGLINFRLNKWFQQTHPITAHHE
ncbi:serine hydrolase [Aerococcaceae bacterium zg-ZUI334]|uniref:serine hydrolase n=1 Tax=Aerococcaceae bacterium zg-252 TaxID=2796928 RepID=UPI001B9F2F9E|nr:serine hydrolase [Aerococcaceae bacterium zg-ZUI334]